MAPSLIYRDGFSRMLFPSLQVSATFAASLVVSPAFGSFLDHEFGPTAVYAVAVTIAALDLLYIFFLVPESKPVTETPGGGMYAYTCSRAISLQGGKSSEHPAPVRPQFYSLPRFPDARIRRQNAV